MNNKWMHTAALIISAPAVAALWILMIADATDPSSQMSWVHSDKYGGRWVTAVDTAIVTFMATCVWIIGVGRAAKLWRTGGKREPLEVRQKDSQRARQRDREGDRKKDRKR